jgi:hypothetical protein
MGDQRWSSTWRVLGEGYTPSCELVRTPGSPSAEHGSRSKASRAVNALESTTRHERVPSRDVLTRPGRTWGTREAGARTIEEEYEQHLARPAPLPPGMICAELSDGAGHLHKGSMSYREKRA